MFNQYINYKVVDLDVIVPVYNEEGNIRVLTQRLVKALTNARINYNIIFVDDYSTDNTVKEIVKAAQEYSSGKVYSRHNRLLYDPEKEAKEVEVLFDSPHIKLIKKVGPRGKAFSILQGSRLGNAPFIAMIDGDLQYPPEDLPAMYQIAKEYGIANAQRVDSGRSFIRKLGTKLNILFIEKLLLGLKCDSQSGMKVFKREIIETLDTSTVTPWTLDIPLLLTALDMGFKIGTSDVIFSERVSGKSKVNLIKTAFEIGRSAVKLKYRKRKIFEIHPTEKDSLIGAGIAYKGKRFITHTRLSHKVTAIHTFMLWQKIIVLIIAGSVITGFLLNPGLTGIVIIALLSIAYFLDLIFSAFLINKSLNDSPEIKVRADELDKIDPHRLPIYSILCPLYKEAGVLPRFTESISKLDWPKDKLDVILLLEENDKKTIKTAHDLDLPSYFRIMVVPHSYPKTKPKACNYGLSFVKGEFTVVYDAEDRPDPMQLKKAYVAFNKINSKVVCLQCKLNYYNSTQNLLTRLFTVEYGLWFDLILPGLQSMNTTIPLGGTSNHFRTSALRYLDGWDPFNVTEDCDLGTRLFKNSFQTAIVDSTTYEEANSRYGSWLKQRSRWIKGYLQTYLVHMRDPIGFYKKYGIHALIFQMITGLRMVFTLVNPTLWITTICYFAFRSIVGPTIEALYPPAIFYIASFSLVFGNFFYLYIYMIAAAKKGQWGLIKYIYLIPVYWFSASIAAAIAFYQLLVKPYYWEKTTHGLTRGKVAADEDYETEITEERISASPAIAKAHIVPALSERKGSIFSGLMTLLKKPEEIAAGGSALIIASILANGLNFVFNAYLGRAIKLSDFGTISLINNIYSLATVLTGAIALTVSYKSAYLLGKYNSPVKKFWRTIRNKAWTASLVFTAVWLASAGLLTNFFKAESIIPFLLFAPFWIIAFVGAVNTGFLSGNLKFIAIALLTAVAPVIKLLLAFLFVEIGFTNGIYLSIPLSTVIPFVIGWMIIAGINEKDHRKVLSSALAFPKNFFGVSILSKISTAVFLSSDIILAKHYLSPTAAGEYALLSLSGKIIYFMGNLFTQFVNPLTSHAEGAQKESRSSFYKIFLLTLASSAIGYVFIGLLGYKVVPILFGSKTGSILHLLPIYSFGIVCFTLASTVISYNQAKGRYSFPILGFIIAGIEMISIHLFHGSVGQIAEAVSLTGVFYIVNISLLHFGYSNLKYLAKTLIDVFTPIKRASGDNNLKILIFNWRDTKHVWAGGSEVYIHEVAKRWINMGYSVTLFCGNDKKNRENETIDGINIIRKGGFYMVYMWAFIYYMFKFRGKFDVIVDVENGIPFFTPLYVREPIIGLVFHVHKDLFIKGLQLPFYRIPMAFIAKNLESILMPVVYRNIQMATISVSSKSDMLKLGFGKEKSIQIINPGVDLSFLKPGGVKTIDPNILYLGRLQPYKSIDTLIKAMKLVIKKHPRAILRIAGFGESRLSLEKLTHKLGLQDHVVFLGKVSEEVKRVLLQEAWIFAYPSLMEGFGISVIEANACGTPVVASDVPGLRDSVKNPSSGFLVRQGSPEEFADKINLLISDDNLRNRFSRESVVWARNFTWDKSSIKLLKVIKTENDKIRTKNSIPQIALIENN